jgi:protein-disulfide isomerase
MKSRTLLLAGLALSAVALSALPRHAATAATQSASSATITDQAIRDWLATHPEVLHKIVADSLKDDSTRAAFDQLVHESLLRQPNIMTEVSMTAQAKQQADRAAMLQKALPAAHDALYNDPRDGREGVAKPAATVVIFYDPECPYCKSIQPAIARLVQEHADVAVVYKDFPILGPISTFSAKAALAAVAQGKYPAFHEALMTSKIPEHQLKEEQVLDMAKTAGLDIDRLKTDMAAPEIDAKIAANKGLAASLGIQGTPGVIIGNQLVPGNVPYERLVQLVDEAKTAGKQTALLK